MASTYLTRTPSTQGSLRKITFSAWVKKADPETSTTWQQIFTQSDTDGDPAFYIGFKNDKLMVDGGSALKKQTNMVSKTKIESNILKKRNMLTATCIAQHVSFGKKVVDF